MGQWFAALGSILAAGVALWIARNGSTARLRFYETISGDHRTNIEQQLDWLTLTIVNAGYNSVLVLEALGCMDGTRASAIITVPGDYRQNSVFDWMWNDGCGGSYLASQVVRVSCSGTQRADTVVPARKISGSTLILEGGVEATTHHLERHIP